MFEADGRNSLQSLGHFGGQLIRGFLWAVFFVCVAPVIFALYMWQTMEVQRGAMASLPQDPRLQGVLVDFNTAAFKLQDIEAWKTWAGQTEIHVDPALQALPFTATLLADQHPKGNLAWTPVPMPKGNAWVYYQLPFEQDAVRDPHFGAAFQDWIYNPTKRDVDPIGLETLNAPLQNLDTVGMQTMLSDPWFLQGLGKLAPTKDWDWNSPLLLAHAKASYNHKAYVGAARAVARMRMFVALVAAGQDPGAYMSGRDLNPVYVAKDMDPTQQPVFRQAYVEAFQGDLPRMLLLVQPLDDQTLLNTDEMREWHSRAKGAHWDIRIKIKGPASGPFITGMVEWSGYHPYDRETNTMSFTFGDFFYRSTPAVLPDAAKAQATLTAMQSFKFWEPRLRKHGIQGPQLDKARTLLIASADRLAREVKFTRRHGHVLYHD